MLLKLDWRISNFRHSRKQSNKQLTKMLDTVFSENWIFYLDIGGWISANAFYTCRSKLIAYCVEQRQTIARKSNKIFDISLISFHQIFMRITRTHRGPWRTEDGLPLFLCRNIFQPNSICREENANTLCINSPSSAPPKRKTKDWCQEETVKTIKWVFNVDKNAGSHTITGSVNLAPTYFS